MIQTRILTYHCGICGELNYPYDKTPHELPHDCRVKCNKCGHLEPIEWKDSETSKEVILRKMGGDRPQLISKIQILENRIQALESGRDADRKEIQLLRQTIDLLIKNEIKSLKDNHADQSFNLNGIHERLLKVEKELEEKRRHFNKKDGR